MDWLLLELFIYLKLRIALCDFLEKRVAMIWQGFYFLTIICIKFQLLFSGNIEWDIILPAFVRALLCTLPLYFLWYIKKLGGADVKHGFLENIVHGNLLSYTCFCLALISLYIFNITHDMIHKKMVNCGKNTNKTVPSTTCSQLEAESTSLLPTWIMYMFLLAFCK